MDWISWRFILIKRQKLWERLPTWRLKTINLWTIGPSAVYGFIVFIAYLPHTFYDLQLETLLHTKYILPSLNSIRPSSISGLERCKKNQVTKWSRKFAWVLRLAILIPKSAIVAYVNCSCDLHTRSRWRYYLDNAERDRRYADALWLTWSYLSLFAAQLLVRAGQNTV